MADSIGSIISQRWAVVHEAVIWLIKMITVPYSGREEV